MLSRVVDCWHYDTQAPAVNRYTARTSPPPRFSQGSPPMRNDAHDEFDDVPSLTPDRRDDDDFEPEPQPYALSLIHI